ncbi:MAG: hypothetical protein ACE366_17595 [Bradymonadia bacterium]
MPSTLHEVIVECFTESPQLATQLWQAAGLPPLPAHDTVTSGKINLAQSTPAAYDADESTILTLGTVPQMALIIEVQLSIDNEKRYSWPYYAASARARKRCPAIVLVIAPEPSVARWASRPIEVGDGNTYTPRVLGPDQVPVISNPQHATSHPELTLLSIIMHGESEHSLELVAPAVALVSSLDERRFTLYTDMALARFSQVAQEVFIHMLSDIEITEPFSDHYKALVEKKVSEKVAQILSDPEKVEQFREELMAQKAQELASGMASEMATEMASAMASEMASAMASEMASQALLDKTRHTLKKQMRLKFQGLSDEYMAIIDAVEIDALDRALERILTAETPDDVLG